MKRRTKKIISTFLTFSLIVTCTLVLGSFNTYAADKNPIVLVHGMASTSAVFSGIMSYLKRNYSSNVKMIAVNLPNGNSVTDANVRKIADAVDKLKSESGGEVDLIAHSLGGANSFNYIRKEKAFDKIDKIVTLGGANTLSGYTAVPDGVTCTSIVGTMDFIVMKPLSTLRGATMVTVNTDHITMLFNNQVNQEIVKALGGPSSSSSASGQGGSNPGCGN